MNDLFLKDYERFTPNKYSIIGSVVRQFRNHELRFIYLGRKNQISANWVVKKVTSILLRGYRRKYGLELNFKNTGGGIRLIHPWNITVNDNAVLGENVTLYKGSTIGEITSGSKKGNPIIGNNVIVYATATICGNVKIGDGSEISAGAFVNFDVPKNSVVIGNPGIIHCKNK